MQLFVQGIHFFTLSSPFLITFLSNVAAHHSSSGLKITLFRPLEGGKNLSSIGRASPRRRSRIGGGKKNLLSSTLRCENPLGRDDTSKALLIRVSLGVFFFALQLEFKRRSDREIQPELVSTLSKRNERNSL